MLLLIIFVNITFLSGQVNSSEKIDYGIAISNVEIIEGGRIDNSNSDSLSNRNLTSSQLIYFQFIITHWNPNSHEQWVSYSERNDKINLDIQLDNSVHGSGPSVKVKNYAQGASYLNEVYQSGITNISYGRTDSSPLSRVFIAVLNYEGKGLPQGSYHFVHTSICLKPYEEADWGIYCESHNIDKSINIKYPGVLVKSTENGVNITYDTLPITWGEVNLDENLDLLYSFSFNIFSLTFLTLYIVRKRISNY